MIFTDIKDFIINIDRKKRLLGVDLGTKKIGIAVSDCRQTISTPYLVYQRRNMKKDMGYINGLFNEKDCTAMVLGMPEGVGEKDNDWVEKVILFAKKISKCYNIDVYLQDETLTTQEACTALKGLSNEKVQLKNDKVAASCILQRVLYIMQLNN